MCRILTGNDLQKGGGCINIFSLHTKKWLDDMSCGKFSFLLINGLEEYRRICR